MKKIMLAGLLFYGMIFTGVGHKGLIGVAYARRPDLDLGEIVVRPFDYGYGMEDLPFSSSIITWDEIEKSNIFSFSEALDELPGIKINRTGNFGRSDVQIRGLGDRGRKVMILVDGRPSKMGLFGCTITQALPVDNIQRIELVRGPSSVLYGSDALGGAVNIVTRSRYEEGFNTSLRTSYGSFNTAQVRTIHSGNIDNFSYLLTGGRTISDGFRNNSAYDSKSYTLGMEHELGKASNISFRGRYYDGRKEEPAPDYSWSEYERGAVEIDYEIRGENTGYALKAYRNFGEHFFSDESNYRDFTNGMILTSVFEMSGDNKLSCGAEFRQQAGEIVYHPEDFIDEGNWDKYEYAAYFLYNHNLAKNLTASAGLRYNVDEISGDMLSWQAGTIYRITDKTRLRLNRSGGFRAPQINDLYTFPPSNEDLEAENSVNYEAGLRQHMMVGTYIDLSLFRVTGNNIIERVSNETPPPRQVFKNSGNFEFWGGEFMVNAQLGKTAGARVSYSYLDPGEFTRGRPANKVNTSLSFQQGRVYARFGAKHVSSYYSKNESQGKLDDYTVLSSKLNYKLLDNLKAFMKTDNILNESYSTYVDLPGSSPDESVYKMPGRNFIFGLSYDF